MLDESLTGRWEFQAGGTIAEQPSARARLAPLSLLSVLTGGRKKILAESNHAQRKKNQTPCGEKDPSQIEDKVLCQVHNRILSC